MERKHLLLCVTGSVAAIKTKQLVEELTRVGGFEVRLVTTENALHFFDPSTLNVPIYRDIDEWNSWTDRGDPVLHIVLRDWADVLLLAPFSANSLAACANGLANNLVTTLVRAWWFPVSEGTNKPVFFAPAMNTRMWKHPFTEEHMEKLINKLRWICIHPTTKRLMCGEEGVGAMAEPSDIVLYVRQYCGNVDSN